MENIGAHTAATLDKAKDEDAQAHGFVTLRIKPKDGVCAK